MDTYGPVIFFLLCLTIRIVMFWPGECMEARDSRKGSMAGSESRPQLISIRILTCRSNAALLIASSMTGQYLMYRGNRGGKKKPKSYTVWCKQTISNIMVPLCGPCRSSSPLRMYEACGGEVFHDGHVNVVAGTWDDWQDGFQVLGPRQRTERGRRTLGQNTERYGMSQNRQNKENVLQKILSW